MSEVSEVSGAPTEHDAPLTQAQIDALWRVAGSGEARIGRTTSMGSVASATAKVLLRKGLVERGAGRAHGMVSTVKLTEAGKAALDPAAHSQELGSS